MTHESTSSHGIPLIFTELLDGHFEAGNPRRHSPGTQSGEEEVFLEPQPEVADFIPGPVPEMIRAVRPKYDNFMPVRKRSPPEIVGHRLEIRQRIGDDRDALVATVYFLNTAGEIAAGRPPLLRKDVSADTGNFYVAHRLPSGETFHEDLGSLWPEHTERTVLDENAASKLFHFIGACVCRDPRRTD